MTMGQTIKRYKNEYIHAILLVLVLWFLLAQISFLFVNRRSKESDGLLLGCCATMMFGDHWTQIFHGEIKL